MSTYRGSLRDQIKAIGIIGTDVYDKLLILHALKDSFKHKTFFTTDLDARFLHKDQSAWARNLVIASNFDFSLHRELQGTIMPFRDSYQTSTYLATLVALDPGVINKVDNWVDPRVDPRMILYNIMFLDYKLNALLAPQIFEIGRTQAIHLASPTNEFLDKWIKNPSPKFTESNELNHSSCSANKFEECKTIELDRTKRIDWEVICVTLISLLFVAYISWRFFKETLINLTNGMKYEAHGTQQPVVDDGASAAQQSDSLVQPINQQADRKDAKPAHIVYILLLVPILLFLMIFLIYKDNYPTHTYGEPFLLFEGVSVWPNLIIRFAGIMMMILLFICHFRPDREREIRAIEKKYELCKTTCLRSWQEAIWKGPFLNLTEEKSTHIAYGSRLAEVDNI